MAELRICFFLLAMGLLITNCFMLTWQIGAYRRHHHLSFAVLAIATLLSIVYSLLILLPNVCSGLAPAFPTLYVMAAVCGFLQMPIALWGTYSLYRSYRELSRGNSKVDP